MLGDWPKISVITPSFNQAEFLEQTIDSVRMQDYPHLEYIVIDGGSADGSKEILERNSDFISYWESTPDKGQSNALNKGFSRASGDIFCWINSDDQLAPNALWSVALEFVQNSPDMVAGICEIFADGELFERHLTSCATGKLTLAELLDLDNGWNAGQFFYQPEVFFSRELWESAGGYVHESLYYSMDYELWCRFAAAGAQLSVIGTPLAHFRRHAEQKTNDELAFKKELILVRDKLVETYQVGPSTQQRPRVNWSKKLKVAMVNNLGFLYGAGIAQQRIAASFEMAGQIVRSFDFLSYSADVEAELVQAVIKFNPDLVIFGNLHGNHSVPTSVIEELSLKFQSLWLTHDYWLFTGRCGYPGDCQKWLTGCDSSCPTSQEYPALDPQLIQDAWRAKRAILNFNNNLQVVANSEWSKTQFQKGLIRTDSQDKLKSATLGVPTWLFEVMDKGTARDSLGIARDAFVVFFSASSLSDARKGGQTVVEALQQCSISNLAVLVVGRADQTLDIENARMVYLGYVDDHELLRSAMSAADIHVSGSTEETFGQVFIEAAMCGLPSIAFDTSGMQTSVAPGISGELVFPFTVQALANAIDGIYEDLDHLRQLSKLAPIFARNRFSLEASYHSFFQICKAIGIVDQAGVAHKISLSLRSKVIDETPESFLSALEARSIKRITAIATIALLNWFVPTKARAWLNRELPPWLSRAIVKWLYR